MLPLLGRSGWYVGGFLPLGKSIRFPLPRQSVGKGCIRARGHCFLSKDGKERGGSKTETDARKTTPRLVGWINGQNARQSVALNDRDTCRSSACRHRNWFPKRSEEHTSELQSRPHLV